MSKVSVKFQMDEDLKNSFDNFCANIGMTMGAAFSVFARQAVRTQRIPFEISADPFYSETNMRRLEKAVNAIRSGEAVLTEHELINAD